MKEKWVIVSPGDGRTEEGCSWVGKRTLHPIMMQEDGTAPGQTPTEQLRYSDENWRDPGALSLLIATLS